MIENTKSLESNLSDESWKLGCRVCHYVVLDGDFLRATNPFDPQEVIIGCPDCKSIGSLYTLCDEPGCEQEATMVIPTPNGYRRTCYKHLPPEDNIRTKTSRP